MIVELAVDHLIGSLRDPAGALLVEHAQLAIGQGRCLLDHSEGVHDLDRHAVFADREVRERALRLRAPVAVGRHLDLAHGVALDPGLGTGHADSPDLRAGLYDSGNHEGYAGSKERFQT